MALSKYGMLKHAAGYDASRIFSLVQFDLQWVTANWASSGCDLWEEIRSDDFYWNRAAFVYSLQIAADFADIMGDSGASSFYRSTASSILPTALAHFDTSKGYIYETLDQGREKDSSVLHATATFGEYVHAPNSAEVAQTIKVYTKTFCQEYPIVRDDISRNLTGVLMGRYPGDNYMGWQSLAAFDGCFRRSFLFGG